MTECQKIPNTLEEHNETLVEKDLSEEAVDNFVAENTAPPKVQRRRLRHQLSQDLSVPGTGWSFSAKIAVLVTIIACCSNVVFLELLVIQDPGIGNLITFAQFLVISIEGFVVTTRFGTVPPKVPFSAWLVLVVMYFLVSVTNNYALSYNIPMPLHMIFRAGSLMANMLLGVIILGKQYSMSKYVSILMITAGIITCTYSSTSSKSVKGGDEDKEESWIMVGISLLTFALFMSARMGIYQVNVSFRNFVMTSFQSRKWCTPSMENTPARPCSTPTLFLSLDFSCWPQTSSTTGTSSCPQHRSPSSRSFRACCST